MWGQGPGRCAAKIARALFAVALPPLVAACALDYSQYSYYPRKSDARPHPGVAKAHRLPIHGIDVSKWQGKIDWAAVRDAGTQFAFIKATEGGDHLDERFHENWYGAKAAGIPRGAYHFVYWCRPAHEQAAWFRQNVPADPDALPPVLDLEWNGHSRTCPRKVSRDVALDTVRFLLAEMEAHTGKRPIVYTDVAFHRDVLAGELDDYPYWLRSTAAEPEERYANRPWLMWQYTTTGRIPGIRGDVDRNAFYGSPAEWTQFVHSDCDPRQYARYAALGACNATVTATASASPASAGPLASR